MRTLRRTWSRFLGLFTGRRRDAGMAAEMEAHLAMLADDNVRQGMTPEEARRAAALTFGSLESAKESVREQRSVPLFESLWLDARYALRALRKNPGFTAAAVSTLALGIGANAAIFTVVNAVVLKPLPYPGADRMVMVWQTKTVDPKMFPDPASVRDLFVRWMPDNNLFDRWSRHSHSFEAMAGFSPWTFSLTGGGEPERLKGTLVTPGLLTMLGTQPFLGRGFLPEEDQLGNDRVVLLSHRLWLRRFAGTPGVLGTKVIIDGNPHTVIGILPPGFRLDLPRAEADPDILAPTTHYMAIQSRKWTIFYIGARLKPGVPRAQAHAELIALTEGLARERPRLYAGSGVNLVPMAEEMAWRVRPALLVLAGASGCVLLIVCANLANLLVARAISRRRESGIRAVLGASRRRLIQQTLVEGVLLALAGGVVGMLLAKWGVQALVAAAPEDLLPRIQGIAVDLRVLGFVLLASLVTGLLIGAVPAWQGSRWYRRGELNERLKEGGRSSTAAGSRRIRSLLVVAEIALALVVLAGAGLLIRSFARLTAVDLGFQREQTLAVNLTLPESKYREPFASNAFADGLLERVQALPGVRSAAITNSLPIATGVTQSWGVTIEGRPKGADEASMYFRTVSPGYFETMGIAARKGRLFTAADSSRDVVLINQAMIHRYWPDVAEGSMEPVGRRVQLDKKWCEIVGVVSNIKHAGPAAETSPELYAPFHSSPSRWMALVVRVAGDPMRFVPAVRSAVWSLDRDQPIEKIQTMDEVVAGSVAKPRFQMLLLVVFAGSALAVATVGIYGVIAYAVSERTQEIGIRMALGAARFEVLRMVLGEGLILAVAGIAIGLAAATGVTRVLKSFLYGTDPIDAATFAAVALLLLAIATAASYAPARRATRVDPIVALRCE